MIYNIDADFEMLRKMQKTNESVFTQAHLFDFSGKLHIDFAYKGKSRKYDNKFVRIYLFLYELNNFIDQLQKDGNSTWLLGFAPFADGLFVDDRILISSRSGNFFFDNVYGVIEKDEISRLREKIKFDMSLFAP